MSKPQPPKALPVLTDLSNFSRSTFTLTFAIEILGIEVWHDCNEGWLDLGPCSQTIKIQYQLYYGQTFDVDVLIWPHTAKVYCGAEYCWVRTWLYLDRRWLTFSISHAFPVRVADLRNFVATVTPSVGSKADKCLEVYLPPLAFGDRRQFAPVLETLEESLEKYIFDLLWNIMLEYIPPSFFDGQFDAPHSVRDVRHQDAILYHVQEVILSRQITEEIEEPPSEIQIVEAKSMERRQSNKMKESNEKEKKKPAELKQVIKFEIKLPGDTILAGYYGMPIIKLCPTLTIKIQETIVYKIQREISNSAFIQHVRNWVEEWEKPQGAQGVTLISVGRIVPFEMVGKRPHDQGEIIVLISSSSMPANDDLPIFFVNVDTLYDIPLEELKKLRISQLYTRWTIGDETHDSMPQLVKIKNNHNLKMNDHHAVPLNPEIAAEVTSTAFLDNTYEIQLRGIRLPAISQVKPIFFGYQIRDFNFGSALPPKIANEETDILIAVTRIDARSLAKSLNGLVRGDYPLHPPRLAVENMEREGICTNDINAIRASEIPRLYVPPDVILNAQMNLEVSMGLVGCKPKRLAPSFSRLYCLINDSESIMSILRKVTEINDEIALGQLGGFLTGFAIDTGCVILFFLEGPKDGMILQIWEMTEDFYPKVKPVFSSSVRYSSRIYPELLAAAAPFVILKMFVPLAIILACPPIYARPALPLPTRYAALKIGRLIASKLRNVPDRCEMPTAVELKSFRLELCSPPRPPILKLPETSRKLSCITEHNKKPNEPSVGRINWDE